MALPIYRTLAAGLLAGALLGFPEASQAQFSGNVGYPVNQSARIQAGANAAAVAQRRNMYGVPNRVNPSFGYGNAAGYGYGNPYGGNYIENPVGSYLQGASSAINAEGQYLQDRQQAKVVGEQAKQSKIDTRRKQFDEWQYERANTPPQQQYREEAQQLELRRSRNNPPLTEIWSAKALNDLLLGIQTTQSKTGVYGPMVPLDPDVIKHINVNTGTTAGSVGLLKDGGKLQWPSMLTDERFDKDREQLDKLFYLAVKQVSSGGPIDAKNLNGLTKGLNQLRADMKAIIEDVPAPEYIRATRFCNQLQDSIRVLQEPNAANFFSGKWQAKGNSVGDLVEDLTRQGLRFAPVTTGDEAYYTSLYRTMVSYDAGLGQLAAR